MAPKVSVIVPCYNERDTIGLLLEPLYVQDHPLEDPEVIVSGSSMSSC